MENDIHSSRVLLQPMSRRTAILKAHHVRGIAILLLVVGSVSPCAAARPVTVEQLDQILASAHEASDVQIAAQLSDLVLIERLSYTRLSRYEANLPGPRARQALTVLADRSAFLYPPAVEIPVLAEPDTKTQREMIALTVNYVSKTIHQLPNFYAKRVTTSFQDNTSYEESKMARNRGSTLDRLIASQPLHLVDKYSAAVLYRGGREVGHVESTQPRLAGLTTSGEFGPILAIAMLDAVQGHLAWSHWEQGTAGPEAVFRFTVPAEKSHYEISYCCYLKGTGERVYFRQFSAYDGEITLDPSNGTIRRLSLVAGGFKKTDPIFEANILVEYGPVELGGKTYICPLKGIALSMTLEIKAGLGGQESEDFPPLQTSLNDVVFEQYHLYSASSHVLPGFTEQPSKDPPGGAKPPN